MDLTGVPLLASGSIANVFAAAAELCDELEGRAQHEVSTNETANVDQIVTRNLKRLKDEAGERLDTEKIKKWMYDEGYDIRPWLSALIAVREL